MSEVKIYIGCGNDRRDGYLHIDKRQIEGVDLVRDAWNIWPELNDVSEIYSRHMLEHLTSMEGERALRNWYKALAVGGRVHIIVPNLDFHCQQWLEAEWNEDTLHDKWSDARHGFAGLYGWQSECDPASDDYNQSYWDVHKSGYNERRISFILKRIGYSKIETKIVDNVHLDVVAYKSMDPDERQIAPNIRGIRKDHVARYELARDNILPNENVLDAACGVGYGSNILSQKCAHVIGVDISQEAISYAEENYKRANIDFKCMDLKELKLESNKFNTITSFETFEHIDFAEEFLRSCHDLLDDGGQLIFSTPNEKFLPFDESKFKFHVKHYTYEEIEEIMSKTGFFIDRVFSQSNYSVTAENRGLITEGKDGEFMVIIAKKVEKV